MPAGSGRENMPSGSGLLQSPGPGQSQATACRRCRKQKLRCSKETPICRRCNDIGSICEYPPPPDRKALAAQRAQNVRARTSQVTAVDSSPQRSLPQETPRELLPALLSRENNVSIQSVPEIQHIDHYAEQSPIRRYPTTSTYGDQTHFILPALDLALFFIDIYFEKMYFSTLLFHKPTFLKDYRAGKVEEFISLSIFALATVNFREPIQCRRLLEGGQRRGISKSALESAVDMGDEWATLASQKALMYCDQPRREVAQACQNLAIYWLSQGKSDRTHIQQHIAYRVSRILGYHRPAGFESNSLQAEMRRRVFWATWISHCISQDNSTFKTDCWKDAASLPLPCDETSFEHGQPVVQRSFDSEGRLADSETVTGGAEPQRTQSVLAEMAKLIGLWWEIQRHVKKYAAEGHSGTSQNVLKLQELDHKLDLVGEQLDPSKSFKVPSPHDSNDNYLLTAVHCLYHLCGCTLSSALIPLFSNVPAEQSAGILSKKMSRLIAEDAIGHAVAILDIASEFAKNSADVSRLPSMTGFAMFVAVNIYFKSLMAQAKLHRLGRIRPAIAILEELQYYWERLRGPWQSLEALLKTQGFQLEAFQSPSTHHEVTPPEPITKIDQIIAHKPLPENGSTSRIYTFNESDEILTERPRPPSIAFLLENRSSRSPSSVGTTNSTVEHTRNAENQKNATVISSTHILGHQQTTPPASIYPSYVVAQTMTPAIQDHSQTQASVIHPLSYAHNTMDMDINDLWWDQTFDFATDTYAYQLGGWLPPLL